MALDSVGLTEEGAAQVSPSDWQLIDDGSFNGMRKYIRATDEDEGTVQVKYEQDASKILDHNKELQNESWDRRSEWVHFAKIPNIVIMEWLTKHGVNFYNPAHADGVRRLLNDGEYRWIRTKDIII